MPGFAITMEQINDEISFSYDLIITIKSLVWYGLIY
jgi:hypothetical protein